MASDKSKGNEHNEHNEHKGHRQRVKKKFLQNGIDVFEPHEALELYLFYAIPRRDTNPTAHRLLSRYGTIGGVCDAPIDELINDCGLSVKTAVFLKMLPKMSERYVKSKADDCSVIDPDNLEKIFRDKFLSQPNADFAVILGDAKGKMIYFGEISAADSERDGLPLRKIVDLSFRHHAKYVFVGCNRIGGSAEPTESDLKAAANAKSVLKNVGINLVDCLIVTGNDCLSVCTAAT